MGPNRRKDNFVFTENYFPRIWVPYADAYGPSSIKISKPEISKFWIRDFMVAKQRGLVYQVTSVLTRFCESKRKNSALTF